MEHSKCVLNKTFLETLFVREIYQKNHFIPAIASRLLCKSYSLVKSIALTHVPKTNMREIRPSWFIFRPFLVGLFPFPAFFVWARRLPALDWRCDDGSLTAIKDAVDVTTLNNLRSSLWNCSVANFNCHYELMNIKVYVK